MLTTFSFNPRSLRQTVHLVSSSDETINLAEPFHIEAFSQLQSRGYISVFNSCIMKLFHQLALKGTDVEKFRSLERINLSRNKNILRCGLKKCNTLIG